MKIINLSTHALTLSMARRFCFYSRNKISSKLNKILLNNIDCFVYCSTMASASKSKGSKPWKRGKLQVLVSDDKAQEQQTDKYCHKQVMQGILVSERELRKNRKRSYSRWVSRSRSSVKWPPSHINFKSAIEGCMTPTETDTWTLYVLISWARSVDTLEEAQQLQTDTSESDNMTTDADESSGKDEDDTLLRRGHRARVKNRKLAEYDSGFHLGDTTEGTDEEDGEQRHEVQVSRIIEGELGDTLGSANELEVAAKK